LGGFDIPISTVKRAKKDLGWVSSTPHYFQLIREANKPKRVEWCCKCFDESEHLTNVIWTDECSVQLDPHKKTSIPEVRNGKILETSA